MKTKMILLVAGCLAVSVWGYGQLFPSKAAQVRYLVRWNFSHTTTDDLMTFGSDYIKAWYTAARSGKNSFTLSGISYNINGGKKL